MNFHYEKRMQALLLALVIGVVISLADANAEMVQGGGARESFVYHGTVTD